MFLNTFYRLQIIKQCILKCSCCAWFTAVWMAPTGYLAKCKGEQLCFWFAYPRMIWNWKGRLYPAGKQRMAQAKPSHTIPVFFLSLEKCYNFSNIVLLTYGTIWGDTFRHSLQGFPKHLFIKLGIEKGEESCVFMHVVEWRRRNLLSTGIFAQSEGSKCSIKPMHTGIRQVGSKYNIFSREKGKQIGRHICCR